MICSKVAMVLHLWSLHTIDVPNSNTFGAGVECQRQEATYQVGVFENSYNQRAIYGVIGKEWNASEHIKVGGFVGIINGYRANYDEAPVWHGMTPLVGLQTSYALDKGFRIAVQFIPTGADQALVHFTLSKGFAL